MNDATLNTTLRGPGDNAAYDVMAIRRDFPILEKEVYGRPLVYLDNGASAQKPRAVIERMTRVYEEGYANIHRGVHYLSQKATEDYENARQRVAEFLNAGSADEIVFTRNATEAVNLVAASFGRSHLKQGDKVVLSVMEHHANIVPWQLLRDAIGIELRIVPIDGRGELDMDAYVDILKEERIALVAMTHASNALGTVTPAKEIVRLAHERDVPVLLDGSQAVVHRAVDVRALDADFYVFTGHKLYGPTGIGVLYGKKERLAAMPPYQGGGDMIGRVTFEKTTYREPPFRFEAGTPPIVEAIGLAAAIDYVCGVGMEHISTHEQALLEYTTARLDQLDGVHIHGRARNKCAILSFTMDNAHSHDVGTIVDRAGVAVRSGHHCAQPLMDALGLVATARASFAMYNTIEEADALIAALEDVNRIFG